MKTPRNAKLSFYAALATLFESASTFGTAFNVYYEDDLRSNVTPTRPWVYLLDAGIPITAEYLPAIAIWFQPSYRLFQAGGDPFWHVQVACDVFGANRGEREDIAAAIAEGVADSFTIYDYSSTPVAWGTASIYENTAGEYWNIIYESVGDPLRVEGTLLNWASCSSQFWIAPT
jgi:hypothetical protein